MCIELILLVAILAVVVIYYHRNYHDTPHKKEGLQWQDSGGDIILNSGMDYLDIYDTQDLYRNAPYIYPVPYTYETAENFV